MRLIFRVCVVAFIALSALLYTAGDIVDPWHPWGTFGFDTDGRSVVTDVDASDSAAGLRVGDVIDVMRMPFADRAQLWLHSAYAGRPIVLPLRSGRNVTLRAHPRMRTLAENITDVVAVIALVIYTILAGALVLLRPTPSTWAFFLFSAPFLWGGNQDGQYLPLWMNVLQLYLLFPVLQAIAPMAFFSFALRFPNARPSGGAQRAEQVLWYAVAPILAALNHPNLAALLGLTLPRAVIVVVQVAIVALYIPGIVALIARYANSTQDERTRLRWVVATFAIAFLPSVIFTAAEVLSANVISLATANFLEALVVIAPLALAYTILKHRLFDIRFVVSRALIFGFMTTLTVGVLALADWALGKWLEQSRFQLVAEVVLALIIGFSLTSVHKRIETFLNRIIFRAQATALAAIRRFTHEIDLINDPSQLVAQMLQTLRTRLESEYVAAFTADGTTFVQPAPALGGLPALLSPNDLAVLRLRRWSEPFECDAPGHPLQGALLLPMTARTDLIGFIACGPKDDRTHYVPEEVETLQALAHRAGSGYAWLTMRPGSPLQVAPAGAPDAPGMAQA